MRAEKQACKQLQRYKANLFEPASINGLYNLMAQSRASLLCVYTDENLGGRIYTVTKTCAGGSCFRESATPFHTAQNASRALSGIAEFRVSYTPPYTL